jgi:hypothetical protein
MDKIKEYAITNYPKTFKDVSDVIVEENNAVYFVSSHKDGSPIVISKKTING